MSKYNNYARRADEAAKRAFEAYAKAKADYERAEASLRQYPQRRGMVDAQYAVKSARAQADYLQAKAELSNADKVFVNSANEIKKIRAELVSDIETAYGIDPQKLDTNVLELLKSGVLNGDEFVKLLQEAKSANNATMVKLVGRFARAAAEKKGKGSDAATLRMVEREAYEYSGADRLEAFDALSTIYNKCVRNPAMIPAWGELTSTTVENF